MKKNSLKRRQRIYSLLFRVCVAVFAVSAIFAIVATVTHALRDRTSSLPANPPTEPATEPMTGPETETETLPEPKSELDQFIDLTVAYAMCQPEYPVNENGETKYGALFGHPKAQWCTEFVMWCLLQAEKDMDTDYIGTVFPYRDWSGGCVEKYREWGRLRYAESGYVPKKGDLVFFKVLSDSATDHTGLVIGTTEENGQIYVLTIEGNIPTDEIKCIRQRKLPLNDRTLYAYGTFAD